MEWTEGKRRKGGKYEAEQVERKKDMKKGRKVSVGEMGKEK